MDITNKIIEYIKTHTETSFVEIEQIFEDNNFNYKGNRSIASSEHNNVIYWEGWNQEAINIISKVMDSGSIMMHTTQVFTYVIDGKGLSIPIAKCKRHYNNPHWIPIAFTLKETKGV